MTRRKQVRVAAPPPGPWTVEVDALDDEGRGLADVAARRVSIAGTLPGDRAVVTPTWISPTSAWCRADLLSIESPSPRRASIPCAHAPACAGCPLAQLPRQDQLDHKSARLARALASHGLHDARVEELRAAPDEWGWRNRAKYVVNTEVHGPRLGAYWPGTHRVVESRACAAVMPAINHAAQVLETLLQAASFRKGGLSHVVIRAEAGRVLGTLMVRERGRPEVRSLAEAWMRADPAMVGVTEHFQPATGNAIWSQDEGASTVLVGEAQLVVDLDGIPVRLPADAFLQAHAGATAILVSLAHEALQNRPRPAWLVDAYCGVGTFSFALRNRADRILGIEANAAAILAAREAAGAARLDHVVFVAADAAAHLSTLVGHPGRPDVLLVDPPRRGLDPAMLEAVRALAPPTVLYISCDPQSLARDLAALLPAGWELRRMVPVDMFPQTPEVETFAWLERTRAL